MGNDGKLKKSEKGHYDLPMGGPEPSPRGDDRKMRDSSASINPGYDHSGSHPGDSNADIMRGYCHTESITDACKSDGMKGA